MIGSPDYTTTYDPDLDFDAWYTKATAAIIAPRLLPGQRVLELGCATGLMTSLLASTGASIVGVERSAEYLARARARGLAGATFVGSELATFATDERYDHVLATNSTIRAGCSTGSPAGSSPAACSTPRCPTRTRSTAWRPWPMG